MSENIDLFAHLLKVRTDQFFFVLEYYTTPYLVCQVFFYFFQKIFLRPLLRERRKKSISCIRIKRKVLDLGEVNSMCRSAKIILKAILAHKLLAMVADFHLIVKI